MTDRAIAADFTNWRPVVGRRVLQLTLEVPIEETEKVLQVLGSPQPGKSLWCGIALIPEPGSKAEGQVSEANGSPKRWSEYPRSQQAAILCGDPEFWNYFDVPTRENASPEDLAAKKLRYHFRIDSRKELDLPENHARWDEFVALYNLHRDRLK